MGDIPVVDGKTSYKMPVIEGRVYGYIPQKGVDYMTEEEVAELTNLVLETASEKVSGDLGLKVQDGLLCAVYEEEEVEE